MVIPKNAKNVPLALEFMKFIIQEANAKDNSEYVGYTSPKRKGRRRVIPNNL